MNTHITITLNDDDTQHSLPARWVICYACDGNGTHDHPAFADGISSEQFAEDEDFAKAYRAGRFDVSCDECGGAGKVREINEDALNAVQRGIFDRYCEQMSDYARYDREAAYERKMLG